MQSSIPVHAFDGAVGLALGGFSVCVRKADNTLWCWGDYEETSSTPTPTQISVSDVVSVAVGWGYVCAVNAERTLHCWGADTYGQLGTGIFEPNQSYPAPVMGLVGLAAVTAGVWHTCALASGAIYCWGDDQSGELGTGDGISTARPAPVPLTCP
jgi:alpha-tubulin suppressor-like RCC1 family protein